MTNSSKYESIQKQNKNLVQIPINHIIQNNGLKAFSNIKAQ